MSLLNRKQQITLWAGITIFVLMGLFPPWYHTSDTWTQYHYSFLLSPPMRRTYDRSRQKWREYNLPELRFQLDTRRLYVQWAMVVLVTAGLLFTFHKKQQGQPLAGSQQ